MGRFSGRRPAIKPLIILKAFHAVYRIGAPLWYSGPELILNRRKTMSTTEAAVQPARRAQLRWRRILLIVAATLAVILVAGYFGISAYVANKLAVPERFALTSTPAQYGLSYEDVNFTSTVDNIPLS